MTDRTLITETVEGEIGIVIDYVPGVSVAVDVLQGAMRLIEAIDKLDKVLLSSVDTSLEPVSVLNDVQHSSLKMLLARALRHLPDDHLGGLDWKKWVGGLLVKGKYKLLQKLDADAPEIQRTLLELESDYRKAPLLIGYTPPSVADVQEALSDVGRARDTLVGQKVTVQTELGDISLPEGSSHDGPAVLGTPASSVKNIGTEFFKIKSLDMLGHSQWTVLRNGRQVKIDMLHQSWLADYHNRKFALLPGDSIECKFEETVVYDENHNELERHLGVIEVSRVIQPPMQQQLRLPPREDGPPA